MNAKIGRTRGNLHSRFIQTLRGLWIWTSERRSHQRQNRCWCVWRRVYVSSRYSLAGTPLWTRKSTHQPCQRSRTSDQASHRQPSYFKKHTARNQRTAKIRSRNSRNQRILHQRMVHLYARLTTHQAVLDWQRTSHHRQRFIALR